MKQLRETNLASWVKDILFILVGSVIAAAGYGMFLAPGGVATGGVAGLSILLQHVVGWRVGAWVAVLNVPLFLMGWRVGGREFFIKSLIGTAVLSIALEFMPKFETPDKWLSTIYGAVAIGVGFGLVQRAGGSTGGTDLLARMLHKRFPNISVGNMLFGVDLVVVGLSGIVFKSIAAAMYSFVALYISGQVIDTIFNGIRRAKCFWIFTEKPQELATRIVSDLHRGCTRINVVGGYQGQPRQMLMCVVQNQQVIALKRLVAQEDPQAFIILADASEVMGYGFTHKNQPKQLQLEDQDK